MQASGSTSKSFEKVLKCRRLLAGAVFLLQYCIQYFVNHLAAETSNNIDFGQLVTYFHVVTDISSITFIKLQCFDSTNDAILSFYFINSFNLIHLLAYGFRCISKMLVQFRGAAGLFTHILSLLPRIKREIFSMSYFIQQSAF